MEYRPFKAGEITLLTFGKFSDYAVNDLVKVIIDFDLDTVIAEWALVNGSLYQEGRKQPYYVKKRNGLSFFEWLCQQGYTEKIEYRELNTGYDNGEVDILFCDQD